MSDLPVSDKTVLSEETNVLEFMDKNVSDFLIKAHEALML